MGGPERTGAASLQVTTWMLHNHAAFRVSKDLTTQHVLNYVFGPNVKYLVPDIGGQVSISQMPCKAYELTGIFVPDFDNGLESGLNFEPPSIVKLQSITIAHRNGFRKVEKDIFALIRSEVSASPMSHVEIESQRTRCLFFWPMSSDAGRGFGNGLIYQAKMQTRGPPRPLLRSRGPQEV